MASADSQRSPADGRARSSLAERTTCEKAVATWMGELRPDRGIATGADHPPLRGSRREPRGAIRPGHAGDELGPGGASRRDPARHDRGTRAVAPAYAGARR